MVTTSAMILAAGAGTRMRSDRPKPLHRLCGRPMLMYVIDALGELDIDRCVVVVGHGAERVTKELIEWAPSHLRLDFVEQTTRRGTGDAVAVGLSAFSGTELDDEDADLIVLPGDTPLVRPESITAMVDAHRAAAAGGTVMTAVLADATGYGRVLRFEDGRVERIVEHVDATPAEREVREINTSMYCFRRSLVGPALRRVRPDNAQGEYYLTDVIAVLRDAGYPVAAHVADDRLEASGVNDRLQLAEAEAELRRRTNEHWLRNGVTLVDPANTYIDTTVRLGTDVTIFPGSLLQGQTVVGDGCEIGPDTRLDDVVVSRGCRVQRVTAADAEIGADASVGPYVVIRPGASVAAGDEIAPFRVVE